VRGDARAARRRTHQRTDHTACKRRRCDSISSSLPAVFLELLLWIWLWGEWGTVLAVPMLVVIKAEGQRSKVKGQRSKVKGEVPTFALDL
jgi:hypothetical protein